MVMNGQYTATSGGPESFSLTGDTTWTDYRLEVDIINVRDVALIVRAQDTNDYIGLAIRPTSCDWCIRTRGPTGQPQNEFINNVPIPAHDATTIRVAVEVRGNEFFGYVNGELKTTMNTTLFPKGKVGFTLGIQPKGYLDNVIIYGDGTPIAVSSPTPAPLPVPTPSPTPSPIQTPTLSKNDFLITIISSRQATITNNSQRSIEVYQFSMKYDCYSYIMYNAPGGGTSYGRIVRSVLTSDELAVLKPGQSYSKTFNRKDIITIASCSFYIKDVNTGQTLTVTSP